MRYFVLNNIDSRTHGHTLKIERNAMPDLAPVQITIPRKAGVYVPKKRSREVGTTDFKIRLGLLGIGRADFRARVRTAAEWLFNANKNGEAVTFWASDEPARIYRVWVQGATPIEQIEDTGEIEFTLIAPDPFAESTAVSTTLFNTLLETGGVQQVITNNGTYEAYPNFRIVPTNDMTFIRITDGTGKYILLTGRTFPAWTNIIVDNKKGEIYFEATGNSLMNWLTIDSRFFKLEPKTTYTLSIEVDLGAGISARVNWQERFL